MRNTTTESDRDASGWNWVGVAPADTAGRVKLPRALLEEGVFDQHDEAYWGHETNTGTLVVSPRPLELEGYKSLSRPRSIGSQADGHRCTVPHQYTAGDSDQTHIALQGEDPAFNGDEPVHFVYHDVVLEHETPWCFVLPQIEFEKRLLAPADWPETVFPESTRLL
ncbi:hypothetical protein [Haloarchaeobius sp. DYHT-AS-18]|uniref:hypothetical protein n=1 Tax=Haloarchaeobius sp. DYHT-AS-18 TaxID=3446117 RepID=UPI003EB87D82